MKKLLILAGASSHCKLVEAAKRMGLYTIVADYLPDSPAKAIADEQWMTDIRDVDTLARACREKGVDAVAAVCIDPAQKPYQALCDRLGLPCYGTEAQFAVLTDKKKFKAFCETVGVDTIPSFAVGQEPVYPVLVKPAESRGSRGQRICSTPEELAAAIPPARAASANGEVILEKSMAGCQDFTVSYFVAEGIPYLVRTADRYLGNPKDGLGQVCACSISPSRHTARYREVWEEKVLRLIRTLGIQNGPVFFQGFVDGDVLRLYDPGFRLPGAEYERLYAKATGLDLMELTVELALTGKLSRHPEPDSFLLNGITSIQLLPAVDGGVIGNIEGLEAIAAHPSTVDVRMRLRVGDTVEKSGTVGQRLGEIVMMAPKREDCGALIRFVRSKLRVTDRDGNNMLLRGLDPEEW